MLLSKKTIFTSLSSTHFAPIFSEILTKLKFPFATSLAGKPKLKIAATILLQILSSFYIFFHGSKYHGHFVVALIKQALFIKGKPSIIGTNFYFFCYCHKVKKKNDRYLVFKSYHPLRRNGRIKCDIIKSLRFSKHQSLRQRTEKL